MSKFARFALISAAVISAGMTAASPAMADWRRHDRGHGHHERRNNDQALALGLFGLAAGAIVGAAIAVPPAPRYVEPRYRAYPDYDYAPPPAAYVDDYPPAPAPMSARYAPWSPEWYRYCADRYRSFNPNTGTFIGYDNRAHFCNAGLGSNRSI